MIWPIFSYALNTVVMHMVNNHDDIDYWNEYRKADIFIEALELFQRCMQKRQLSHVINADVNLFENLSHKHLAHCASWLANKIDKLKEAKGTDNCRKVWIGIFKKKCNNVEFLR